MPRVCSFPIGFSTPCVIRSAQATTPHQFGLCESAAKVVYRSSNSWNVNEVSHDLNLFSAIDDTNRTCIAMESLLSVGIGLALRAALESVAHGTYQASAIVGIWEGVVLNHFLSRYPSSVDPYVAYAFRLIVDFYFTHSMTRAFIIMLWTGLGLLLSDVALQMSADHRFRRLWRRSTPRKSSKSRSRAASFSSMASTIRSPISPPSPPVRPATHLVPGQYDKYSEITVPTVTGSFAAPSEDNSYSDRLASEHLSSRTPSSLEYGPLPATANVRAPDHIDFDPPPPAVPLQAHVPYSVPSANPTQAIDPADSPRDRSGLTTPTENFALLSRPADPEDLPAAHSGLTTPENMRATAHTSTLPPINVFDVANEPLAELPTQSERPIRLMLADPSPDAVDPPAGPLRPQASLMTIPSVSEIPNIPTPGVEDPPPSFAEATQPPADIESHVDDESVVSMTAGKNAIIAQADRMREQAQEKAKFRDDLRKELNRARNEKRYFDVIRLELDYENAQASVEQLHARAARRYFLAHNVDPQPQEVDVHRLHADEANVQVKRALREALIAGASELRIITGRGKHSKNKIPVLKTSILAELAKYHISSETDKTNPGVLIVKLPKSS